MIVWWLHHAFIVTEVPSRGCVALLRASERVLPYSETGVWFKCVRFGLTSGTSDLAPNLPAKYLVYDCGEFLFLWDPADTSPW